jgi:GT2 family glycosyltransferase
MILTDAHQKMIDLSIIIINYNTFDLTSKCIASIIKFTTGVNYEIILVDNASTEREPEEFQRLFSTIKMIKNSSNLGFARGNNSGLKIARGDIVLLLNSDVEILNNVIGECCQKVKRMPLVGVITCKLVHPDGKVQHQCGRFPSISLQIIELLRLQKLLSKKTRGELLLGGFFDHKSSAYPDWIWGTFFMFKTQVLNCFKGKMLPETYFMYQEDLEWCYLIRRCKYKIFYDPSYQIMHYFSASSPERLISKKKEFLAKNFEDFLTRFYGRPYAKVFFLVQRLNTLLQRNQVK